MGGCIAYDLAALALGQYLGAGNSVGPGPGGEGWAGLLGLYAGGAAVWSALKYKRLGA